MAIIKDNTAFLQSSLTQKAGIFLRLATDSFATLSIQKTPKKTGRLRLDIVKQVVGLTGKITWGKNYAIFQEEKQFRNYTTPGTGPHFASDAASGVVAKTQSIAQQAGLT